jgi:Spy/CpxP family protein refolding chaperone
MGMPRAQRPTKAEMVADKLHLNKDQKEKFAAIVSAGQEEMRPLFEQVFQGRNVITTAIIQGKSGDELAKLMSQYTELMAQRGAVEAKAYAKIYAMLEPKQQAKANAVFAADMDGLFDSAGGRGGRRRQ